MMNYQPPPGVWKEEHRQTWPEEEGAGPFATLGIFALFVIGMFLFSAIVGNLSDEAGMVYVTLAVPPLTGLFIAYRLRSWWWVFYTTLPPGLLGVILLFGGDWITVIGFILIALGGVNAAIMSAATAIAQSRYRANYWRHTNQRIGWPIEKGAIPPQKNPLTEW